jgi:hypothetical protein
MDIIIDVRIGGKIMIPLLIFLLVLVLPLPIKTSVFYSEKKLDIFIYNYKLKEKKAKRKLILSKEASQKKKIWHIIKLGINVLRRNSFKPYINVNINFMYGLEDAANTAELYGLLNSINPVIYKFLGEIFIIKNFNFNVHADFNKTLLKFNMVSIIFINLLTILYVIGIFSTKYLRKKFT